MGKAHFHHNSLGFSLRPRLFLVNTAFLFLEVIQHFVMDILIIYKYVFFIYNSLLIFLAVSLWLLVGHKNSNDLCC